MANPTQVSWTDPTTNVDGTPITAGEITGYSVGVRDTTTVGSTAGTYPFSITAPASAVSQLFSALTPALPTNKLLAVAIRANSAINSAWSVEATFTLAAAPNPPTNPTVA